MPADCAVIIFVKYPEFKKVKTRLAMETGEEFALEFYKVCAGYTFLEASKLDTSKFEVFLYCSNKSEIQKVSGWAGNDFLVRSQEGEDLGERMKKSFREIFNLGFGKAIIIGSDLPDISAKLLEYASSKLDEKDFVIGPSSDGGYYLIGVKNLIPGIFEGIEWSSSSVLSITLKKIRASGKEVFLLDEKIDIDTEEDLKNWIGSPVNPGHPVLRFAVKRYGRQA